MVSVWIAVLCEVDFHSGFSYGYDYCYFLGESPEKVVGGDSVALCLVSEQGSGSKRGLGFFVFLIR
jgi:hypothetical protein